MDSKKIGAFIEEKRVGAKMTQDELANKLKVTNKTIERWETGKETPSVEKLEPLSRLLGVSIAELLSGEDKVTELDVLIKELQNKKKKRIINLILGIVICLFLCSLEVILYIMGVEAKYAYIIIGVVIVLLLVLDIINYFKHK